MDQAITAEPERVRIHLSARASGPGAHAEGKASGAADSAAQNDWRGELAKATCEVFEIMVGTTLTLPAEPSPPFIPDFAAMVGIAGSLCGLVSLRTTADCARRITAKLLGDDDAAGAAGGCAGCLRRSVQHDRRQF